MDGNRCIRGGQQLQQETIASFIFVPFTAISLALVASFGRGLILIHVHLYLNIYIFCYKLRV
jgi:hypothetical protein